MIADAESRASLLEGGLTAGHDGSNFYLSSADGQYLMQIFEQLFKAEGNEIYLKPAIGYIEPDQEIDFYTVLSSALNRNEIAIGYRLIEHQRDRNMNYGIVLNPVKSEKFSLSSIDFVIVLSEN